MFKDHKKLISRVTDTLIGTGTEMSGNLKTQAGVRIEGAFQGDIDSKGDIVIGEGGVAKSNIVAGDVIIAGKVYGDVHTRGKLIITSTGQLHGSSYASVLNIHEGGILNGTSNMDHRKEAKPLGVAVESPSNGGDKKSKQAG
ncbi:bactofilin family protein [Cohnella abietis]|uniref:Cell shape determination protein CcmA n=1 Tax=Cohnella abietis TaxID=2507935 RepID=A0A3T1D179_9BACL|nr:polymer-forming cytoskeletal protein [Cohnella abietis]BBI31811.1 hypothetical protein KCTCHS21_12100 [Cohnella abietis]